MTKDNLIRNIEEFIENKIPSIDGRWANVTNEDLSKLYKIISTIISLKFESDDGGSLPIEVSLTNRNKYESCYYDHSPYVHKDLDAAFETGLFNLNISMDRMNIISKLLRHRRNND